jgi:hypothetical protein
MENHVKQIFAISCMFWNMVSAQAQIVPNGGFEEWDTSETIFPFPHPLMWKWAHAAIPNCPVIPSETMEPSPLSSSGCCSVKLTTHYCKIGFIHSGEFTPDLPRNWAFDCNARPTLLNFQYMFQPEGGDSAFVRILLFDFDSITPGLNFFERVIPVGSASSYIHEAATSFTPYSLPIQYLTADTPAFMHIFFSVSREFVFVPYTPASVGTTFWLDDVHLSVPTDIREQAPQEILTIFPNPAGDRIWFAGSDLTGELYVMIFDAKGAQVMDRRIVGPNDGMDVRALPPGVYSMVVRSNDGRMLRTSWVKE